MEGSSSSTLLGQGTWVEFLVWWAKRIKNSVFCGESFLGSLLPIKFLSLSFIWKYKIFPPTLYLGCTIDPRLYYYGKVEGKRRGSQPTTLGFRRKIYFWIYLSLSLLTIRVVIFRRLKLEWGPGVRCQGGPKLAFDLGLSALPTVI